MERKNCLIDQLVEVLRVYRKLEDGKVESKDPHVNFLIQIMEDLHLMTGNQETIDRFVGNMEGFFNIGVRGNQENETPENYLERRIYDSATYAMLNVLEITSSRNAVGLIGEDYNTELFSKAHRLCAIVFSMVNDLLSYHKDVVLPSGGNLLGLDSNLSYIQVLLKNNKDLSLEQATNQCLDYILESKSQFEAIMKLCVDNCNEKQLDYIRGVEKLMDGMCLWMLYSNRYRHEEQVYEELTKLVDEEKF
ncbi:predicted protein [Naegleria gruberi]|uniref:Predicted protein n=1 Tax=Naegleria gruberi TaxID=5762 RepID=D2VPK5_NAEGR|nr:uncharacterized protein NAEGRDRAFT_70893 [Naegleria gruberi]EFC41139.1 predicted protein [Naegleria gruberi]|eukprot:XP_002673883.1 predicted protein [Naegleria gruberi strain NEG-M]